MYFRQGKFQEAAQSLLDDYRSGKKTFAVITLLIQSMRSLGQHREMADFLAKALMESSLSMKEQAALYYQLGQALFQAKDIVQAKQAFWQAHRLNPNHPGLAEKLKAISQKESRPQHRYSLLITRGHLSEEKLTELSQSAKENNEDLDQLLLRDTQLSKEALGESLSTFYEVPFVEFDPDFEAPFELLEKRKLDPEYLNAQGGPPWRLRATPSPC